MNKKRIYNQISQFFKNKPVLKAYVFGSFSRNEENIESDIDLLVDLDWSKPIGWEFIDMRLELEDLLHRKVDLISRDSLSKYIKKNVERDLKVIYERKPRR